VAADEDDGTGIGGGGESLLQLEAVEPRHREVHDDAAGRVVRFTIEKILRGGKHADGESVRFEQPSERFQDQHVVVDDADVTLRHSGLPWTAHREATPNRRRRTSGFT